MRRCLAAPFIALVALIAVLGCAGSVSAQTAASAQQSQATAISASDDARAKAAHGDLDGAISELTSYLLQHPEDSFARRYLGDLYFRAADLRGAEREYLALLLRSPGDKQTHDRLGNVYALEDRIPEAISEYGKSLPDAIAYSDLLRLHKKVGDLDTWINDYRRTAESTPEDAAAQFGYGTILLDEHKASDAVGYLQRAERLVPRSCPTLNELGNTYLELEDNTAAYSAFKRCLQLEPDNYTAMIGLSSTYDPIRESAPALAILGRAVQLRPERPEGFVNLGYMQDALGNSSGAASDYQKAIALDVLCRDAYVDLGYDLLTDRDYPAAQSVFLKGLSVSPGDGRLEYLLGRTYLDQGKEDLARQQFVKAALSDEADVARAASQRLAVK